ncbi:UNVERIFIED_CONTAM: hypothetical protein K2H54_036200 [Gekko kuhli]
MVSAKEMIHKGQKHLTELLQKNSDVVLDRLLSKCVITKEEQEALGKVEEDSKKAIRVLQEKGEATCRNFLECVEMACPGSNLSLQRSLHTAEPSSIAEGVAELQSKTVIPGSTPIGDIPCSAETKEGLWGEALSETATEGPVDLEPTFSLEEMKKDSKKKSPGTMGEMKAKAREVYSSVMNYLDPEQMWEAEVEQARAQQSRSVFTDGMSKEAEGSLILPTSSANGEQLPHSIGKRSPDILVQQGAEGDPLVPPYQGGMLDNSIEDVLFTMFDDLTPQEQHAVTERLEHTKNCLLAWKVPDLSEQQAIRGDATVDSNSHPSMQVSTAPQSFPPIDVEMATEQSGTGTSAAITDSPQMPKNGSVFFIGIGYSIRLLNLTKKWVNVR